ncbi:chemotaxis protein [Halioxenophilus sp. WMMB6]|uniref:chemotaxis protein n=1 Tax=Halioxenophilus sp. WMMB6 TaxID=3073815 RepID=UPI00295F408C|nr:chemotaxis protein [Halioxenophilus sp. WMMB6]
MSTLKAEHAQGVLLFRLSGSQVFGLGTLKIKEIIPYAPITPIPHQSGSVLGALNFRGKTITVIDLAQAMGKRAIPEAERGHCFLIITDVQRQLVGFLVRRIERIININWRDIQPPDTALGQQTYITGLVQTDGLLVQLLDVEVIMLRLFPLAHNRAKAPVTDVQREKLKARHILLVDDSRAARKQLSEALDYISVPYFFTDNGQLALDYMRDQAAEGNPVDILVSDIEMPGLDGYELAFAVRDNPALARAYIILHTSLSSEISVGQAHQVGANEALTKFNAPELIEAMLRGAESFED